MLHIVIPIGVALIAFYMVLKWKKRGHSYGEMTTSQGNPCPAQSEKRKAVLGKFRAFKKAPNMEVQRDKSKRRRVTMRMLMGSARRNRRFDLFLKRRGVCISD
ncbi:hypothetical protein MTO96_005085 [Rhipicephalus appendiculatus]